LEIKDGKARLKDDIYCDGLGACLGECPEGALRVIQREAQEFDEQAVEELLAEEKARHSQDLPMACGCPSSAAMELQPVNVPKTPPAGRSKSQLGHWPIKLQLLGPQAPFLKGKDLLLLADCAAAAYPNLHSELLPGRSIALACPKLDNAQAHIDKLAQVLAGAQPRSLSVVHMEVPCCKGLEIIAQKALEKAGMDLTLGSMTISRDGQVLQSQSLPWESAA
jgi:ferredoxin